MTFKSQFYTPLKEPQLVALGYKIFSTFELCVCELYFNTTDDFLQI